MIKLISDSTCDLTKEELAAQGISTLPLTIHFGQESFRDGIDITKKAFYQRLGQAKTLPTTSQVPPGDFEELYRRLLGPGDELLAVTIASGLSATHQSALAAAEAVDRERIHVVDSMSGSFGHALLLSHAVRLRDEGRLSAGQIAAQLRQFAPRIRLYAVVDTLRYLKMGGRLSGSAALIGGLLGIKPLVQVQEGKVTSIGKVRGDRNVVKTLYEHFTTARPDLSLGYAFGHSEASRLMRDAMEHFEARLGQPAAVTTELGAVIGTHTGPGVIGVAFMVRD